MNEVGENPRQNQSDQSEEPPSDQGPSGFACSVCGRAFRRAENLKRHAASHSSERRFRCFHAGCNKAFYRPDALQRHEAVHQSNGKSRRTRSSRACVSCASARVKCSGETPCARCRSRSSTCTYSQKRTGEQQAELHTPITPTSGPENHLEVQAVPESSMFSAPSDQVFGENSGWPQAPNEVQNPRSLDPISSSDLGSDNRSRGVNNRIATEHLYQPVQGRQPGDSLDVTSGHLSMNMNHLQGLSQTYGLDEYFGPTMLSSVNWLPPDFSFPSADTNTDSSMQFSQLIPGLPIDTQIFDYAMPNAVLESEADTILSQYNASHASYTSPAQSGSDGHEMSQPALSVTSPSLTQPGGYYVDGDGARLPRNGRRRKAKTPLSKTSPFARLSEDNQRFTKFTFSFPDVDDSEATGPQSAPVYLSESFYQEMLGLFHQSCASASIFTPFGTSYFPRLRTLDWYIRLYFEQFQPVFPLIHLPTFDISNEHPLVSLSMAAIGSHYAEVEGCEFTTVALHEFVRRVTCIMETRDSSKVNDNAIVLSKLLNCIGLFYAGFNGFAQFSRKCHVDLADTFDQIISKRASNVGNAQHDWAVWRENEIHVRLIAGIWLLDTMIAYHFQVCPRIPCGTDILLPCEESLWEASNASAWQDGSRSTPENLSLQRVLQTLYMEKRLPAQCGEWAKICLLHGLYREIWQVADSVRRPLSRWSPTAERIEATSVPSDIWLPRIPKYQNWRNASCDVIDVLHWRANSIIATSGTENPTVHHLHFARIVLLTPYENILRLAVFTAGESRSYSEETVRLDRQLVRRWAVEDQYKARLAMIHAGVGFWHIRRYSTGAFYEPTHIFFSTLAVWAYGSFSQLVVSCEQSARHESGSDSESAAPTSVRLDRPTDDELVQLYVKDGLKMKATISGVGNISGPNGPVRILKEGCKILREVTTWGISARYIRILSNLAEKYDQLRAAGGTVVP